MRSIFHFVAEPAAHAVGLRLFIDADGSERAEILGPLLTPPHRSVRTPERCLVDRATALLAATRIAHVHDTEIQVTGDPALWNPDWGELILEQGRDGAAGF